MAQNRKAPAYQEYASDMLASLNFRVMTMEARGLLYTLRLEYWQNGKMPRNSKELSKALGKEVSEASIIEVLAFFNEDDGYLISPELEDYRNHLEERKRKQSQGGKKGAKTTNSKRTKHESGNIETDSSSMPRVPRRGSRVSLVENSKKKVNQEEVNQEEGSFSTEHSFLNEDGSDPLDSLLLESSKFCPKCDGEGCGYCEKGHGELKSTCPS